MKTRTITLHIANKINHWLKSIDDKELRELVKEDIFVSGGAIASMYLQHPVNDFDVYFKTPNIAFRMANYYLTKFFNEYKGNFPKKECWVYNNTSKTDTFGHNYCHMKGIDYKDHWDKKLNNIKPKKAEEIPELNIDTVNHEVMKNDLGIYIKSAGALTIDGENYQYFETLDPGELDQYEFLKDLTKENKEKKKKRAMYFPTYITQNGFMLTGDIQLIFRFVGAPDVVHKSFDFIHATNYFHFKRQEITNRLIPTIELNQKALECLLSKQLKYSNSEYPIAALCRVRKFLKRGYTITAGEMLKISFQISELDLKDPSVLYNQLMGVDLAYFSQLINAIENAKKNNVEVDQTYIGELIDNIFG